MYTSPMFQNLNGQKVAPQILSPVEKAKEAVGAKPSGVDLYARFALAGAIGVSVGESRGQMLVWICVDCAGNHAVSMNLIH